MPEFGAQYFGPGPQAGWASASTAEQIRTVIGLHPDVLDYNPLAQFHDGELATTSSTRAQLAFSKRTGIPGTAGWNVTIKPEPERAMRRYGNLMEERSWEYPDGRPLENPLGILAERFDGSPHKIKFTFGTSGIPSAFAPGTLDLLVHVTHRRLAQGFAGFFVDGVGIFRFQGLDFSVWATSAFRDHLQQLSPERLAELEIDDPAAFDIRTYLESAGLTPNNPADPRQDPVFREYLLHHHLGIRSFFEAYRDAVETRFPERLAQGHIKLYGNQFMGNFGGPQAANVYVSDFFDLINTEIFPTVQPGVDFVYKLLEALGRFAKPSLAKGTLNALGGDRKKALDPSQAHRMLKRFQMAEALANGARFKPPLTPRSGYSVEDSITNWIQADGTVHEDLQRFIDFVWAQRRFLEAAESKAPVAVIWSLPTRLWQHEPRYGFGQGSPHIDSFVGSTRLLREAQVPYDVLVFGHSRLWDDTDQLERLTSYQAVILPGVQCLSSNQLVSLGEYLDESGTVITSGPAPDRDEMFAPSDDVTELFNRAGATVLTDDPGRQRAVEGSADESLLNALPVSPITGSDLPMLAASRFVQTAESRTVVHLLNYDYAPASDSFERKTDVELRITSPDHSVGIARYFTPQNIVDLEISKGDNALEMTVPEVVEWGFVVLAPDADSLVNGAAKAPAESRVETAQQRLVNARETDRDWGDSWAIAEVKFDAATTALEYMAYRQAERAASAAIEAVEQTFPRPSVGIDVAHNQLDSLDRDNPFEWLETQLSELQYTQVDGWTQQAFDEIDVLLVPPALAFRGQSHAFSSAELDRLERFVRSGGSLVVMVRGGVARDIDQLTQRFGYRFRGPPIVFPEDHPSEVPTRDHPLTDGVDTITASLATSIEQLPQQARVLAAVPEDSSAWFHQDEPLSERSEAEESAAGVPVFTHGQHGDGQVVLLGTHGYLVTPEHTVNAFPLMENLLTNMGESAVRAREEAPTSTSPSSPSPRASSEAAPHTTSHLADQVTTTNGQPGFTMLAGLIGGVVGLLRYWRRSNQDKEEM